MDNEAQRRRLPAECRVVGGYPDVVIGPGRRAGGYLMHGRRRGGDLEHWQAPPPPPDVAGERGVGGFDRYRPALTDGGLDLVPYLRSGQIRQVRGRALSDP